jgi:acyl-CoA synthetase (AMP-forming)/AMP-acid ligase II
MTGARRGQGRLVAPGMTLWEAFAATMAAAPPGRDVVVADEGRVTAPRLLAAAISVGDQLVAAGVQPEQGVLLLIPNSARYAAALFGIARAGATAIPLDPRLTTRELAQIVAVTKAAAAVTGTPEAAQAVRAAFDEARPGGAGTVVDCGTLPEAAVAGGGAGREDGQGPPDPGQHASPLGRPPVSAAAVLFFTSGTTGAPKGVAHSHRSLIASFLALERMHREFFTGPVTQRVRRVVTVTHRYGARTLRAAGTQVWLTAIPFHAIGGHEVLAGALLGGHTLVTTCDFHPRRTMELLASERANIFPATPAMVESVLALRDFASYDLSSLLVVGLGGAPAPPDLVRRAQAGFGCSVTVGYGSTETGGAVLVTRIDDSDEVKRETVGRPLPGADVRIVDGQGRDVPPGATGELLCRADTLMAGYASPAGDMAAGAAIDDAGWFHTSDLAVRDGDGNVRIVGRRDDMVIRGGQKIQPAEVEDVLRGARGVAACAVVGVTAARVGQQVWAFVVPAGGQAPPDRAALLAHCRANLAPYKVPDHFRFCESLPMTPLGKVQRYRLAQLAAGVPGTATGEVTPGPGSGGGGGEHHDEREDRR